MPEANEPTPMFDLTDCFADDETVRVKLPGTRFWVEVKRQLTAGEQADVDEALFESVSIDQRRQAAESGQKLYLSLARQRFLRLATYIADWNLTDSTGKTVRLPARLSERAEIMRNLKAKVVDLLTEAIDSVVAEAEEVEKAESDDETNPTPAVPVTG